MSRKDTWTEILNLTAQKYVERQLGVKMTKRQFNAYCRAIYKQQAQDDLEQAIAVVEQNGHKVTKPRTTCRPG